MANQYSGSLKERFEEKYTPEPNSGCWLWTGCLNHLGYGQVAVRGKVWRAHRASWLLHRGEIPAGMSVLHRCDNRQCVNPDHLFLGTQIDNIADMVTKGRNRSPGAHGSTNGMAALNEEDVWAIRWMCRLSLFKQSEIAKSYGVSPMAVSRIVNEQAWKHVSWNLA